MSESCDSMGCSLLGSSVHELSQARILEWVAIPSSRESSRPRDQTCVSYISCATTDTTWEAQGKWKLMMLNTVFIYLSAIWVSGYLSGKTPAKVCVCFLKCVIGVSFSWYTDFLGYILFQILFPLCTLPLKLAWWCFLMNRSSELVKSYLSVFFFVVSTLFF